MEEYYELPDYRCLFTIFLDKNNYVRFAKHYCRYKNYKKYC